jgi:hypothetical protein
MVTALTIAALGSAIGVTTTHADTTPPPIGAAVVPVAVSTSITTLPLLGASLTVDVTTGPGGALASIAIDPADGFTATTVKSHKVAFVNDAGTARVVVKSKHGGQTVEAKAGSLLDISGTGGWEGDVFGTGTTTHVAFTVGAATDGTPDITNVTSDDTTSVIGATEYSNGDGDDHEGDDDESSARVRIKFILGTQARTLTIKASVHTDDGETRAKVSVSLSRMKSNALPADQVVGHQQWKGVLCDGTAATIDFEVAADGTVSGVVVSPVTAVVESAENTIGVRFDTGERVRIKVQDHDGMRSIRVDEKIRCNFTAPTVNTPTSLGGDNHDGDDHQRDGDRHNRDGSTTTIEPTTTAAATTTAAP